MEGGSIHCRVTNLSFRDENGKPRSAVAKAAYNSGKDLWIEREQRTTTLRPRFDVLHSEIITPPAAPTWAQDRTKLWNTVERTAKRKDARLAKNIQVAITRGIPEEQWPQMIRDYAAPWRELGHVVDVAIHDDGISDNPHAHIMLTVNTLKPNGFGPKIKSVDLRKFVPQARRRWADITNQYLQANGLPLKVTHKSYAAQGLARQPTKHRGPNRQERAAKQNKQRANARPIQQEPMMSEHDKSPWSQGSKQPTLETEPYEDNIPTTEPKPEPARDWFEDALDNVRAEQTAHDPITNEDLRNRTGLTVETKPERDLLLTTQDAPPAIQQLVEDEIAFQQDQRQGYAEQQKRLDVLSKHLSKDQQQALNQVLEENVRLQPPYPEPEPQHEPHIESEQTKARERMREDYERKDQPDR